VEKFDMQKFNLRKLNDMEVKKEYQIKISNRSADFATLDDNADVGGLGKLL
jgi:hypothetical protein